MDKENLKRIGVTASGVTLIASLIVLATSKEQRGREVSLGLVVASGFMMLLYSQMPVMKSQEQKAPKEG
jgi:hypothetical protein